MKKKTYSDLGKDPVFSLVLHLAVPTMIANFVNVLYNIVDRMYIGNIPEVGGLALAGHPLRHKNCDALVISDTGFTVYHYSIDNLSALQMNLDGVTYQYIAVG